MPIKGREPTLQSTATNADRVAQNADTTSKAYYCSTKILLGLVSGTISLPILMDPTGRIEYWYAIGTPARDFEIISKCAPPHLHCCSDEE